jgi:hypothetical protein
VNTCNVDGAVRLRADNSDEQRVSQVATVLDTYVLQPNVTDACLADPKCIVSGQPVTVGIGVSETQVGGFRAAFFLLPHVLLVGPGAVARCLCHTSRSPRRCCVEIDVVCATRWW